MSSNEPTSNAAEPLISIRQITKRFDGAVALDDVSCDFLAGELHAVVGENGAGKSTLMKILSGVINEFEGELRIRGTERRFANPREAEKAGVAIIHQELNLVESLTAAANIFLGREKRNRLGLLDDWSMAHGARQLLAELECHIAPQQLVRELRVGDQQLVEIAKALSLEAEILIMDEPTSALSDREVERLFRVIDRLRARGVTILYISHKMDEVFRLADRITVLRDGRLVRSLPARETNRREITHWMVGREIESTQIEPRKPSDDAILEVQDLSLPDVRDPERWRLNDVSFRLRRGEILGFAGLMGAGRTEILECLFGFRGEPFTGTIRLAGNVVRFRHPAEAVAAGLALVSEDRKRLGLFSHLDLEQNVTLCTLKDVVRWGTLNGRLERTIAAGAIERVGVRTAGLEVPITSLSGGNQQKSIIGRWLLTKPQVLLLDDPTRGIDVGAKAELYRLMDELCRQGMSIIVTSSELPELLTLCDRILVLCEGRLTAEFDRQTATEQKIMEAATSREVRLGSPPSL